MWPDNHKSMWIITALKYFLCSKLEIKPFDIYELLIFLDFFCFNMKITALVMAEYN